MTTIQLTDEQLVLLQDILDCVEPDQFLEEGYSDDYHDHVIDLMNQIIKKLL